MTYTLFCQMYYKNIYRLTCTICKQNGYTWDPEDHADICQSIMIRFEKIKPWDHYPADFEKLNWASIWIRHHAKSWLRTNTRQDHHTENPLFNSVSTVEPHDKSLDILMENMLSIRDQIIAKMRMMDYTAVEIQGVTGMSRAEYEIAPARIRSLLVARAEFTEPVERTKHAPNRYEDDETPIYIPPELKRLISHFKQDPTADRNRERVLSRQRQSEAAKRRVRTRSATGQYV